MHVEIWCHWCHWYGPKPRPRVSVQSSMLGAAVACCVLAGIWNLEESRGQGAGTLPRARRFLRSGLTLQQTPGPECSSLDWISHHGLYFKDLVIYLLMKMQSNTAVFDPLVHSPNLWLELDPCEIGASSGLLHGFRDPSTWAVVSCFSGYIGRIWIGSEAVEMQTKAFLGCWCCRQRIMRLCHCADPQILFF